MSIPLGPPCHFDNDSDESQMPSDFLERKQTQAQKQDSDPAVKLRRLIQCHANPGANWAERCLALVDEMEGKINELDALWTESNASYYDMMAERDALRARLASTNPPITNP